MESFYRRLGLEEWVHLRQFAGHGGAILSVAVAVPGLITGSADGSAKLWSLDTGLCLRTFTGHLNGVTAVAAFDEGAVLTGSFDCTVKLWDAGTGSCLRTYDNHDRHVTAVSACGNSSTFVTTSYDKTAKLWTATSTKNIASLRGLVHESYSM